MFTMFFCLKYWIIFYTLQQFRESLELPVNPADVNAGSDLNADPKSYIEGDIRLTEVEPYLSPGFNLRNAVADKAKVWTNGIVPYTIDSTFFSKDQIATIKDAMNEIQEKTCVQFNVRQDEMPYLFITVLSSCWSEIGMPPEEGIRTLSLGNACTEQRGTVVHELLHILGFWHEQNRPDRDDYVTIKWENIAEGMEHNFAKYSANKVDNLGEPYDYNSIMHYASFAFAKNTDKPTIEPRIPVMIGQRFALSQVDIRKINKLYKCSGKPKPVASWVVRPDEDENNDNGSHRPEIMGSSTTGVSQKLPNPDIKFDQTEQSIIIFPSITELVPLPFRFNWSHPRPKPPTSSEIVFPTD